MMFNWKLWAKGLLAAAISGTSTAAIGALASPDALGNPKALGAIAGAGALTGGLSYLKTHPPLVDESQAPAGV